MGEAVVALIPFDPRFPGAWDLAANHFRQALTVGGGDRDWSLQDVYDLACRGHVRLWAGVEDNRLFGAAATIEKQMPQRKVMEILLMGTDPHQEEKWLQCLEQLKEFARLTGCAAVVGAGRPGWARKLGAEERRSFEVML